MSYSVGDWVQYTLHPGSVPMLVSAVMCDGSMLCSVCHWGGDWKVVSPWLVKKVELDPVDAICHMSMYGGWFYNNKTLRSIFQETLVHALISRGVKRDGCDNNHDVPSVK